MKIKVTISEAVWQLYDLFTGRKLCDASDNSTPECLLASNPST